MAQNLVGEREHPVDLGHRRRFGDDLDEEVEAFGLVLQLVGEGPATPAVDAADGSTVGAHELGHAVGRRPDVVLIQADIEDDSDFVGPQGGSPPPDPASLTSGAPLDRGRGEYDLVIVADNPRSPGGLPPGTSSRPAVSLRLPEPPVLPRPPEIAPQVGRGVVGLVR